MSEQEWLELLEKQEGVISLDYVKSNYVHITSKDVVLKLSSSRVPGMCIIKSTKCSFHGVSFKEHRPDTIDVLWMGKDFDCEDKVINEVLYSTVQNCLAIKSKVSMLDLIGKWHFINRMRLGNEINTNTSK